MSTRTLTPKRVARGSVPARTLAPKGVDTWWCARKDTGPEWGGHEVGCQKGHWPRMGWTRGGVSERTLVPNEVDTRWCASEDARSRKGWIVRSHIDWRREQVPARTLGLVGGRIVKSHIGWGGEQSILYKGVETSP